ncbi:MAG: hypothetical protein U9Q69_03260 [Nanoarchaeota archaeon]|nr:hypothetical protein [Nanoarchaeota archaeon]
MPYLKFASKIEREKAREICNGIAKKNGWDFPGLVALVSDPKYGLVLFLSEQPYMEKIVEEGLKYDIIPKGQISAIYVYALRQFYPDFSDELY